MPPSVHLCTQKSNKMIVAAMVREPVVPEPVGTRKCLHRPKERLTSATGRSTICCGGWAPADFALLEPHLLLRRGPGRRTARQSRRRRRDRALPVRAEFRRPTWSRTRTARDVETILVGREGAVGGIVSEGYLPAYTRIMVKFGGPFVRLRVARLEAAKTQIRRPCATCSRATRTACWRRCSSPPPATQSTRSNSAPPNGSYRRWSGPTATPSAADP